MTLGAGGHAADLTEEELLHLDALVGELEGESPEVEAGGEESATADEAEAVGTGEREREVARDVLSTVDGALAALLEVGLGVEEGTPFGGLVEARERALQTVGRLPP
jgi:hypothetical protein